MNDRPQPESTFPGFKSDAARRSFHFAAIAAIGAAFLLRFLVGQFLPLRFPYCDADSVVEWRGDFWYVSSSIPGASRYLTRADRERIETPYALPDTVVWLIPRGKKLWILSDEGLTEYDGKSMTHLPGRTLPGPVPRPYAVNGRVAVPIPEADRKTCTIYVRDGDDWRKQSAFPIPWTRVFSRTAGAWNSGVLAGAPAVFHGPLEEDYSRLFRNTVAVSVLENGRWRTRLNLPLNAPILNLGAYRNPDGQHLVLQMLPCPWMFHVLRIEKDRVTSVRQVGAFNPFHNAPSTSAANIIAQWAIPIMLIYVFAVLIRKHRYPNYVLYHVIAAYAPFNRRAIARLIDFAIASAPFLSLAMLFIFTGQIHSFPALQRFWLRAAVSFWAGIAWLILLAFLFSYTEGRWGKTPGKWLLGLSVVDMEIRHCGFKRALLRNILLLLDCLFGGMLGIICVAFSIHHQRVGDLVAHTLVIADAQTHALSDANKLT